MDEELIARIVLGVLMTGCGLLLIWTARATADGRLKRNPLAGIRTADTFASEEAWQAGHRAGRRPTEIGGWVSVAAGAAAFVAPSMAMVAVAVLVATVLMVALVLVAAVRATKAARAVTGHADSVG